jgi:hypothetical protein
MLARYPFIGAGIRQRIGKMSRNAEDGRIALRKSMTVAVCAVAVCALVPALALAHIERASYWPDPTADTSVRPPAGGAVPSVRPLSTALDATAPGDTRVVCQPDSMQRLDAGLAAAQATGYTIRPSQPPIKVSKLDAQKLRSFNQRLFAACTYSSIQKAVTDSHNNDRVVIMPGIYTEPDSRAALTNDPACADLREINDRGETGAVSYRYQYHCPNDQNLIAVLGRAPKLNPDGTEVSPPQPPLEDRRVIPDAGPCIRCNLQIEGSGVGPDDVVIEGADPSLGDHSPADADQDHYPKDVGIRADRADGFVLTNLKVRHFNEHSVYVPETDGFHLSRLRTAYSGEYGVLTFVADHSLIENCDAWGNGDSGLYPGASADLGDAVPAVLRRYGTEIRNCDMRHNALGYSGTDGNAVWVHHNELYDNTQGFSTDVFTAPGHPGFPQDSDLIENNDFYSNNFNTYLPTCRAGESPGPNGPSQGCTDVISSVPVPVGVGLWIAGGNHNIVRNNRFWDNWRRGTMLFAVPDQLVCGPAGVDPTQLAGCNPNAALPSTSYNNQFYGNVMGRTPDGRVDKNGTDFWWDEYAGNTGNCWHDNTGSDGTPRTITSVPIQSPLPGPPSEPHTLPDDCATSVGAGGAEQDAELLACFAAISGGPTEVCDWFTTPTEP